MFKKIRNSANTVLLSMLVLFTSQASASLITEEWQVLVNTSDVLTIPAGSTLTWQVTYDENSAAHEYDDGFDGVAGTADDMLVGTYDARCPTGNLCGFASFYTGFSSSGISALLTQIDDYAAVAGLFAFDVNPINIQHRIEHSPSIQDLTIINDQHTVFIDPFVGIFLSSYMDLNGGFVDLAIDLSVLQVNKVTQRVPEPSTLAIFALALFGFSLRKKAH